jgi:hypothetical protein
MLVLSVLLCSCGVQVPEREAAGQVSQAIQSAGEASAVLQNQAEAPRHTVKAPPFRPATRDEIEDLNGTFRTEGSRDRLLRRIEFARERDTRQHLLGVFRQVTAKLPPQERGIATAKLAGVLGRVGVP